MRRDAPPREPHGAEPLDAVGRVRGPSGEALEAAGLRVAPADVGRLREVVSARGGALLPLAQDGVRPTGSVALVHPIDGTGMHLVDLRSPEPGWIMGTLAAFRDRQVL